MRGLVQGGQFAYRNRAVIGRVGRNIGTYGQRAYNNLRNYRRPSMGKRSSSRNGPPSKRRRFAGSITGGAAFTGNTLSRRRNKTTLKKPPTTRALVTAGYRALTRGVTGLTNFDVNVGKYLLSNDSAPDGSVRLPIHMLNLTGIDNNIADLTTVVTPHLQLAWNNSSNAAVCIVTPFTGTNNIGANVQNWQTIAGPAGPYLVRRAHLISTYVAFNFYGARVRDTQFKVHLLSFKDDDADVLVKTDPESTAFITGLERPLTFNQLTPSAPRWAHNVKFHKTWTYNVPATTNDSLNTATGNVLEAKINIKHNKLFTLVNNESATTGREGHLNDASYDVDVQLVRNAPMPKQRLYLYITAFAPQRVTRGSETAAETPSYDMIVRQKWMVPTANRPQ